MKKEISNKARLYHILDAIAEIRLYIEGYDYEKFAKDSKTRFATIKQLEIIGEAANNISDEIKDKSLEIEWRQIIALRNIMVHKYFGIRNEVIWNICKNQLLELDNQIKKVLDLYFKSI